MVVALAAARWGGRQGLALGEELAEEAVEGQEEGAELAAAAQSHPSKQALQWRLPRRDTTRRCRRVAPARQDSSSGSTSCGGAPPRQG